MLKIQASLFCMCNEISTRNFVLHRKKHAGETDSQPVLKTNDAFYWARELVFTRNKLIVFTTSREPPHYVVFS